MNRWISKTSPRPSPRFRLFCFPYAGGSATIYRDWPRDLPADVEVCAVNLPGRGSRFDEAPHHQMSSLTAALAEGLAAEMDRPFAFFGHSMGAMVAFELARTLRRKGARAPGHLFLSGRPGPEPSPRPHAEGPLSDEDLTEMLAALNGTSQSALANKELVALMLPMLRADMTIVQSHVYADEAPLEPGITVFGGDTDPTADKAGLLRWRAQTSAAFRLHVVSGDHFFLNVNREPLLRVVATTLDLLARGADIDRVHSNPSLYSTPCTLP